MEKRNHIGLDSKRSKELALNLNDLLADYSVFYQNTRGFHWNIRGEKFFELHLKFEELYNDLFMKIDEIAERILTLGHVPEYRFTRYLEDAKVKECRQATDGKKCVEEILNTFKIILEKERTILEISAEMNDEGTNALMSDYIRAQEKLVWMYSAFLNK